MPITINGSGTVTGISAGGLPDDCITTAEIASGAVTTAKISGGPAFRAYPNAATSLGTSTLVKVLFQVEDFDTDNCFASSRFTPNVAGYYQMSSTVRADIASQSALHLYSYKNGSTYATGSFTGVVSQSVSSTISTLVYLKGSTDYFEIYCYSSVTGNIFVDSVQTWFAGCLVRPA